MKCFFEEEAIEDLREAAGYYEYQRSGLGTEFFVEVGMAIGRILEAPARWAKVAGDIRKYRIERFPYGIFYRTSTDGSILVIAVYDLRRRPDGWKARLN
jgi:toxin ParE1/3/4